MRKFLLLGCLLNIPIYAPAAELPAQDLAAMTKALILAGSKGYIEFLKFRPYLANTAYVSVAEAAAPNDKRFPGPPLKYPKIYRGTINLHANGKRLLADSLDGPGAWTAYVAGPNPGATAMYLLGDQVAVDAGPSYFRKAGVVLQPVVCDRIDAGNYDATYFASVSGSRPAVMQISKSTGSAGVWYSYALFWSDFQIGALKPDLTLGDCNVID